MKGNVSSILNMICGEKFNFRIDTTNTPREEVEKLIKDSGLRLIDLRFWGNSNELGIFGGLLEAEKI